MRIEQDHSEWLSEYSGGQSRTKPGIRDTTDTTPQENDFTGVVEGHDRIPGGEYWVSYVRHEVKEFRKYGTTKLVVYFSIREGHFAGSIIRAFYTLSRSRRGLVMREGSRWVDEMRSLFPILAENARDPMRRPDPMPVSLIQGKLILVRVEDSKQKKRKEHERPFSVIRRLLKIKTEPC